MFLRLFHRKFLTYVCLSLCLISLWTSLKKYSKALKEDPNDIYIDDTVQRPPRVILLWNKLIFDKEWSLPAGTLGPSYFKSQHCPVTNCVVTNNKHFLPSVDRFDAILFHVATLPDVQYAAPRVRNPAQLYVFSMTESPVRTLINLGECQGFFNLTMTYRLDSDVPWPYLAIEDVRSGAVVAPALKPLWLSPPSVHQDEELEGLVKTKTKFAVWFVSHCVTSSGRERLVKKLQEFVDVDMYGDCGPLKCRQYAKECHDMVERDYKFYISFENSLCVDYVTEKLLIPLSLNVIPVVFGGADYSRFAPPHSYIDANDFKDAKELAEYLKFVGNSPEEYVRYFWWRKYYRAVFSQVFCDICARVNGQLRQSQVQVYSDIETWWMKNSCYRKPRIDFEEDS